MGERLLPATLTWLCEPHETVQSVLGPNARVRLFGSGTHDSAKADDIDLLVESNTVIEQPAPVAARMGALLQWAAGNQRIDGLIAAPMGPRKPIIRSHGPACIVLCTRRSGKTGAGLAICLDPAYLVAAHVPPTANRMPLCDSPRYFARRPARTDLC